MSYDWERQSCEDQRNERATDVHDCPECGKSLITKHDGSADYNCMCPEREWWKYGDYICGECPNCHRGRMMVCTDNVGQNRVVCEKCEWEPDANNYVQATGGRVV